MNDDSKPTRESLEDQRAVLAEFGGLALKANDLQHILQEACRLVGRGLQVDLAKVMELHPDGRSLLVRAGVGWNPGVVGYLSIPVEPGSSETQAIESGKPFMCSDVENEPYFKIPAFIRDHGVRSLVNVPILGSGTNPPYGILQVDSRRPRAFSRSDIDFLRGYANLLASSVERLNLLPKLQAAIDEKQQLLREMQHRMKNNLQIITGFIAIQSQNARTQDARRELQSIGDRIETLRLMHDKLYATGEIDHIDVGAYLVELSATLLRFHGDGSAAVQLRTEVENFVVPTTVAVPLGLMVNEFVTNSLKYAFENGSGIIGLKLGRTGRRSLRLTLWDDGKGLPGGGETQGTGMALIEGFVNQIGGTSSWECEGGTRLAIVFDV